MTDWLAASVAKISPTAKLSPKEAHTRAVENLSRSSRAAQLRCAFTKDRSRNHSYFSPTTGSQQPVSRCRIFARSPRRILARKLCVCLPQRDSMLLFPSVDKAFRAEMVSVIRKNEADARKPLSVWLLFQTRPNWTSRV
jgi:hypothetical protein